MIWYKKYLTVYDKSFDDAPRELIDSIRNSLAQQQSEQPVISVVVIAHNEEKHLLANLWSLSDNHCRFPMEIIGVDNKSTDRTSEIYRQLNLPHYSEHRQGPGYARNCGLQHARGKYYVCIDADTIYPPHYIETMAKALEKPKTMAAYSLWSYIPDRQHSWFAVKMYELMRDTYLRMQAIKRPELCVRGMVFAHNLEYARKVGGYRTDLKRGEDGSMALALKPYGKLRFIHNRKARPVTGYGTVDKDGSLFNSFKIRAIKAMKNIGNLFLAKKEYKDEESNLIK